MELMEFMEIGRPEPADRMARVGFLDFPMSRFAC
jgi:hypothetical protein